MLLQLISTRALRAHARFSLREILLAMTAVAALLALAMESGSWFGPTPFFEQFNPFRDVRLAYADEGLELGVIQGDRGAEREGRVSRQVFSFCVQSDALEPSHAMQLFRKRIEQDLKASGAKITGERYTGRPGAERLERFCYFYEDHWRRGEIIAYLIPSNAGEFKVAGVVHEF